MRDRRGGLHLHGGAVATMVRWASGQSRRWPAGLEAVQLHLPLLLGTRGHHRRFTNMWGQVQTNKSVGGLFPNDGDGNAWGDQKLGLPPVLSKQGFKLTDPGRFQ